jgi:aspartate racemase
MNSSQRLLSTASPLRRLTKIALIGGMGPDAGLDALSRFLASCRRQLHREGLPVDDQSYPPHLLVQYDIPDRTAALLEGGEDPLPALIDACSVARTAGAKVVGIACNTAHFWHPDLVDRFPEMEILHIASETARVVKDAQIGTCAVLATVASHQGRLYDRALADVGIQVLPQTETERHTVHRAIFMVKAGQVREAQRILHEVVEELSSRVDAIVLGCTELGIALRPSSTHGEIFIDAADVLADVLVSRAYGALDT